MHARGGGLKTALEQTIAPAEIAARLLERESAVHPGWEPEAARNGHEAELAARERAEWDSADVIFCGSEFVPSHTGRSVSGIVNLADPGRLFAAPLG